MGNINDEKSIFKIAKIIFDWEIGTSCSLTGFVSDADSESGFSPKGKLVLDELKKLYIDKYYHEINAKTGQKLVTRARRNYINSVGGAPAHPIWRYKEEIVNQKVKYTIWRVQ